MDSGTDRGADQPAGAITTPHAPPPAPAPVRARRRLHPAAIRLFAVALLFAGWLGYLVYLVVTLPHTATGAPLILSRPQILVSELDVIARVDDGKGDQIIVEEVLSPKENAPVQVGQKLHVVNLARCRPLKRPEEKEADVQPDWTGPGLYLLPLQRADGDDFKVTPTPPSPGYPPTGGHFGPPRIYPATDAAKAQYRSIRKP